jgi:hypothetical protein
MERYFAEEWKKVGMDEIEACGERSEARLFILFHAVLV